MGATTTTMLSFGIFEDMTPLLRLSDDLSSLFDFTGNERLWLWFGLAAIYHYVVLRTWGVGDFHAMMDLLTMSREKRCFSEACPRRRERWYKCARRCRKRCAKQTPHEECYLAKCAMNLIKLHLPPPLPLKPKKASAPKQAASSSTIEPLTAPQEKSLNGEEKASTDDKQMTVPRRVSRSSMPLIDLARMQYWDSIINGKVSRREAKYRDCDGLYPLHWACSGGPPLPVVQALLAAYPSAARKTDREGSTALHFATHYSASSAVIKAILQAYPKAAQVQDRYGRTPLYHAVEKCAGMDVIQELIQAYPAAITLPCLPFDQRDFQVSRAVAQRTPLYMAWSAVILDRQTRLSRRGKKLDKARLLLMAAHNHSCNMDPLLEKQEEDFKLLHATISFDLYLPEQIVPMAVTMHPEQLQDPDCHGRLPLLQAAASNMFSRRRTNDLIQLLLDAYPAALGTTDKEGKSALHLAVESGKPWSAGVELLFEANPDVIHETDHAGMTPALMAATAVSQASDEDVATSSREVANLNPMGLLTSKEQEMLRRRRFELLKPGVDEQGLSHLEHLSTIYQLLLNDPSAVSMNHRLGLLLQ